jgi:hypothetical protein
MRTSFFANTYLVVFLIFGKYLPGSFLQVVSCIPSIMRISPSFIAREMAVLGLSRE